MKALFRTGIFATCFALALSVAQAQQTIHAVLGTVRAIYPKVQMLEITTDDGSTRHFQWPKKSDGAIQFDKVVSADTIAAEKFTATGRQVIVYYFGDSDVRTVVGVRDLGDESVAKTAGTVVKLNRKEHLLTIKNSSGAEESFHLDPKTVADTAMGVVQGLKCVLSKGDQVRVIATPTDDGATALLILEAV